MPANLITLPHFSVSSAISLPKVDRSLSAFSFHGHTGPRMPFDELQVTISTSYTDRNGCPFVATSASIGR
jgi:hypothetical protein